MTNENIIRIGSALTSIAVAANTIYTVSIESKQQKALPEEKTEPSPVEVLDYLTKQLNRI